MQQAPQLAPTNQIASPRLPAGQPMVAAQSKALPNTTGFLDQLATALAACVATAKPAAAGGAAQLTPPGPVAAAQVAAEQGAQQIAPVQSAPAQAVPDPVQTVPVPAIGALPLPPAVVTQQQPDGAAQRPRPAHADRREFEGCLRGHVGGCSRDRSANCDCGTAATVGPAATSGCNAAGSAGPRECRGRERRRSNFGHRGTGCWSSAGGEARRRRRSVCGCTACWHSCHATSSRRAARFDAARHRSARHQPNHDGTGNSAGRDATGAAPIDSRCDNGGAGDAAQHSARIGAQRACGISRRAGCASAGCDGPRT